MEVEIDESKFGMRKYKQGRQVEGHPATGAHTHTGCGSDVELL